MKNNIYLSILSALITILLIYIFLYFNSYLSLKNNSIYKFNSIEHLNFHKKYSKRIHHLKGGPIWNEKDALPSDFLYITLVNFSKNKKNILFQGDSWAGQLTNKERKEYHLAKNFIIKKSLENNFGFINAGINSFSPTLMKLQLEILSEDFKINPSIVIAYIDQTDIGDENCRYKNNVIIEDNNVVAVKEESFSGKPFDYSKTYGESKIILKKNSYISKIFALTNFRIYFSYKKIIYKIKIKINKLNEEINKCYWPDIQRYLTNSSEKELNYFKESVNSYVNYVVDKNIDKLFLVTFPHQNHLDSAKIEKKYNHNVSDIIDKIKFNSNKVEHINFSKLIKDGQIKIDKDMYYKNDPASHLSDKFYADVFLKKIMEIVIKQ